MIDGYQRIRALTFEVKVDLVESLGADKYVYFSTAGWAAHSAQLDKLAAESDAHENQFVARVPAAVKGGDRAVDRVGVRHHEACRFRRRLRGEPDHCAVWGTVTPILDQVRAHLRRQFADAEPDSASVTFLGTESIEVLRFRESDGLMHYVSLGCSRHPMTDPTQIIDDRTRGPRAEVVLCLRDPGPVTGIARSLAVLAATPAVEGLVLTADALVDLGSPLWAGPAGRVPFTAVLLGPSDIAGSAAGAAPRPGAIPLGDSHHRDRGGLGAAERRRGHATGVAERRRRRAGSESPCRATELIPGSINCALRALTARLWRANRGIPALDAHSTNGPS